MMSKFHILGAFLMMATWAGNVTSTSIPTVQGFQIGTPAEANVRWTPNPRRGSASSTIPGGTRTTNASACALDGDVPDPAIALLVPEENYGYTTQAQPTLSWYIQSEDVVDMEFVLFYPGDATPLYEQKMQSEGGLVEVTLPESAALEAGTQYHWSVYVNCDNEGRPLHTRSYIERVDNPAISEQLGGRSSIEQARTFAEQGIWYDALSTFVTSYREDAQLSTLIEIRDLLHQAENDIPLELSLAVDS